jgi:photosystem II stability/assembly factor-like uncharacterized protein
MRSGLHHAILLFAPWLALAQASAAGWTPLGPFGGSASVVAADPNSPKTFIAGTRNGLLFRTTDAGDSWTEIGFPAQMSAMLNTLVVDPQTRGVYMAGMSSSLPQYSGILRSTDGGETWQQLPELRGHQVFAIAFKRANALLAAAGTESGVYLSEDGGATWAPASTSDEQPQPAVSVAFDPRDSATVYAGTPHLPWKTRDAGASWHSIHVGMLDDSDVFSIQPDRNHPLRVFASACSGIYRSMNGGASWTKLMEAKDASYRTYVITQDPQYENRWFAGTTSGIVRSLDGGTTWVRLAPFATYSIAFDPGKLGRILIATNEAGILRSEDSGKTWKPANYGFCNQRLSALWTKEHAVYAASAGGVAKPGVFKLSEDLDEWEQLPTGPEGQPELTSVAAPPWAPGLILATSPDGPIVSENDGMDWQSSLAELEGIRAFEALDMPWIAALGPSGVLISRDAKTWVRRSPAGGEVLGIAATAARTLLAATSSGLRISDDLGATWRPVRGEMAEDTVQAICRHPSKRSEIFAAKYGAIYLSPDAGRTWRRISPPNWPIHSVKRMTVLPGAPDRLFVLTPQQGVWELPLDAQTIAQSLVR